jgi:FkbM family methyltransferase
MEIWIKTLLKEFTIGPNCTVLDVGANLGHRAVAYATAAKSCEIWAYEPIPRTFSTMLYNLKRSTSLVRKALQTGRLKPFLTGMSNSSSTLFADIPDPKVIKYKSGAVSLVTSGVVEKIEKGYLRALVRVSTIDEEVKKLKGAAVSFVKIDAEGLDLRVLHGMETSLRHNKIEAFMWEHHGNYETDAVIGSARIEVEFVATFGYHVYIAGSDRMNLKTFRVDGKHWRRYFEIPGKGPYFGGVMDFFAVRAQSPFETQIISKSVVDPSCVT